MEKTKCGLLFIVLGPKQAKGGYANKELLIFTKKRTSTSRQIDLNGSLLQTIYHFGSLLKLFTHDLNL